MFGTVFMLLMAIVKVFGDCQSPPPVKYFDRKAFGGSWRIHTVIGKPVLGPVPPCYAMKLTGAERYNVSISYRDGDKIKSISGEEVSGEHGMFVFRLQGSDVKMVVLDTDYSSYHTSYQCNMEDPTRNTILVALRSTERDELLIKNQITKALKLVNVTGSRFDSDQKECPNKLSAVKKYLW